MEARARIKEHWRARGSLVEFLPFDTVQRCGPFYGLRVVLSH